MLVIGAAVKLTSPGEVIFRQVRVTTYGKRFYIYKFRTMVAGAPGKGSQVTVSGDARVTGVGKFLRRVRLDELPQLFNILKGEMSFVGTRPEVEKDVDETYVNEILPAKMEYNLQYIKNYSLCKDILIVFHTVLAVFF